MDIHQLRLQSGVRLLLCPVLATGRPQRSGSRRSAPVGPEAIDAGVSELILTGGEPFLLPDLDQIVAVCTAALPTTLLTNGMLFRGRRLATLRGMDSGG